MTAIILPDRCQKPTTIFRFAAIGMMGLSIVVGILDGGPYSTEALEQIPAHECPMHELIVVEGDNSGCLTETLECSRDRICVLIFEPDRWKVEAIMNRDVAARGDRLPLCMGEEDLPALGRLTTSGLTI